MKADHLRIVFCMCMLLSLAYGPVINADQAIYVVDDPDLITSINKITILPIVTVDNLPADREAKLMDEVRKKLALELALKGYVLKRADRFSPNRELTATEVAAMSSEELATLGPENTRYIMICFLNAVETSKLVIAESAEARIAAVLIDKQNGQVLWKNESNKSATLSWFNVGLIVTWIYNEDSLAIYAAFRSLFEPFPDKPMD